jgi:hypothetical protein
LWEMSVGIISHKILPATSTCCETVVRNKYMDDFSSFLSLIQDQN